MANIKNTGSRTQAVPFKIGTSHLVHVTGAAFLFVVKHEGHFTVLTTVTLLVRGIFTINYKVAALAVMAHS